MKTKTLTCALNCRRELRLKKILSLLFTISAILMVQLVQGQPDTDKQFERIEEIVERIAEPVFPESIFLITDYNAEHGNAGPAIQKAITEANLSGGGKVLIPPGNWFIKGPIHLKSNVNLHISDGAEVKFSAEPGDYLPQVLTRWEGTEVYNLSPLIYAYQVHNVAITGKGILNGNADIEFASWRDKQGKAQDSLRSMGAKGIPVYKRVFGLNDYLRPSFIQFYSSSKILVEGVTIKNSPMWVNHFIYSTHITFRNVTVKSYRLNNDGVVLDSSTLALIEGSSFSTGDDSIVIKSGRDQDGWRVSKPSEEIVIRDNYMEGHNALAVGSEMSGGVQNIFMDNNRLGEVESAIYFKSNLDRGGYIRRVFVRKTEVEHADKLLRFHTNYHSYRGGKNPAIYEQFRIEDTYAKSARVGIEILGVSQMPARDIRIKNLKVEEVIIPQNISNVENLRYHNVIMNWVKISVDE